MSLGKSFWPIRLVSSKSRNVQTVHVNLKRLKARALTLLLQMFHGIPGIPGISYIAFSSLRFGGDHLKTTS